MRCVGLRAWKWCTESPCPRSSCCVHIQLTAELLFFLQPRRQPFDLPIDLARVIAGRPVLGTSAVIAKYLDHQRVVTLPFILDGLQQPAYLVVRVSRVRRIYFGLVRQQLLLVWGQ